MASQSSDERRSIVARSIVTIAIWGISLAIIEKITLMNMNGNEDLRVLPIVFAILAVSTITLAIWAGDIWHSIRGGAQREKAKNVGYDNAPAQLLLSLLSDEERQRLRSRLMNSVEDGEMVGIEEMLAHEEHRY